MFGPNKPKKNECGKKIEFGDDFGDNSCTFICRKKKNHIGEHKETGNCNNKNYELKWEK